MKELPGKARLYLFSVYVTGAICLWLTLFAFPQVPAEVGALWELAVFAALAAAAGHRKVAMLRFWPGKSENEECSMSLGFAMIFATMLRFGPQGAIVAGIASTISSCLRPRQPWYQFLFNVSINVIETALAGTVFFYLNGGTLRLASMQSLWAVTAACLVFFFLNTGAVAIVVSLVSNQSALRIWRESFVWTAPSYFMGAGASTLASLLLGSNLIGTLICAVPVGLLTHLSFRSYLERAEQLLASKEELATLYLATIRSLALAIDAKDQYTHQHILRVQQYAVATAEAMGIAGSELKAIETGALLHDIGKLGVPEYVLLKPGRLTAEEFAKIKEHPSIGADILDPVKFPWPVLPVVKHHHERWDGLGYPDGLAGEAIPMTARVLAVADVYDALTSSRSYRAAWSHERAMDEIQKNAGTHFDPAIVEAFLGVVDKVRATMADGLLLETTAGNEKTVTVEVGPITTARSTEAVRHIQRASSELWALYEVSQTLSTSLGLDNTLEILGKKLLAIFPDTGCVFLLKNPSPEAGSGGTLFVRFAGGLNHVFLSGSRTLNESSLSVTVAKSHQTYIGSYEHDDLLLTAPDTIPWTPVGTALIVPIVHQGESLGTINLYHAEANAFGTHVQNLLETIAQRAAMALYNGLMYERTRSDAITDPLTGLANTRYITQWIEDRLQSPAPSRNRFALLCLDLDSFKPINDNFGHLKGDQVLQDLARLFCGLVSENDLVGRNGGDEFVFLLHDATPEDAEEMAWRIKSAVQAYNPHLYHPRLGQIRLGVSVGNACYPCQGTDMATLLAVADAAMYEDKTERKLERLVDVARAA